MTRVCDFTAIDFETANRNYDSICQVGITVVKNNEIIFNKMWLVKPPTQEFCFTDIHGITYYDVIDAPDFKNVWAELKGYIEHKIVAAHYAFFDMNVLLAGLAHYGLPIPDFKVIDSCIAAKRAFPFLENHKLDTVAEYLKIHFVHHEAQNDAQACAKILLEIIRQHSAHVEVYENDKILNNYYKLYHKKQIHN